MNSLLFSIVGSLFVGALIVANAYFSNSIPKDSWEGEVAIRIVILQR